MSKYPQKGIRKMTANPTLCKHEHIDCTFNFAEWCEDCGAIRRYKGNGIFHPWQIPTRAAVAEGGRGDKMK